MGYKFQSYLIDTLGPGPSFIRSGGFETQWRIGKGLHAEVFAAVDGLGRTVAVKVWFLSQVGRDEHLQDGLKKVTDDDVFPLLGF
jgi:hypothetical protein